MAFRRFAQALPAKTPSSRPTCWRGPRRGAGSRRAIAGWTPCSAPPWSSDWLSIEWPPQASRLTASRRSAHAWSASRRRRVARRCWPAASPALRLRSVRDAPESNPARRPARRSTAAGRPPRALRPLRAQPGRARRWRFHPLANHAARRRLSRRCDRKLTFQPQSRRRLQDDFPVPWRASTSRSGRARSPGRKKRRTYPIAFTPEAGRPDHDRRARAAGRAHVRGPGTGGEGTPRYRRGQSDAELRLSRRSGEAGRPRSMLHLPPWSVHLRPLSSRSPERVVPAIRPIAASSPARQHRVQRARCSSTTCLRLQDRHPDPVLRSRLVMSRANRRTSSGSTAGSTRRRSAGVRTPRPSRCLKRSIRILLPRGPGVDGRGCRARARHELGARGRIRSSISRRWPRGLPRRPPPAKGVAAAGRVHSGGCRVHHLVVDGSARRRTLQHAARRRRGDPRRRGAGEARPAVLLPRRRLLDLPRQAREPGRPRWGNRRAPGVGSRGRSGIFSLPGTTDERGARDRVDE